MQAWEKGTQQEGTKQGGEGKRLELGMKRFWGYKKPLVGYEEVFGVAEIGKWATEGGTKQGGKGKRLEVEMKRFLGYGKPLVGYEEVFGVVGVGK